MDTQWHNGLRGPSDGPTGLSGPRQPPWYTRTAPRHHQACRIVSELTPETAEAKAIDEAIACLKQGGVVAFATDTLFGLGADVYSIPALEKVFAIKGRPQDMPLPVLVSGWDQVSMVARTAGPTAEMLARKFWPGGLTLVLEKQHGLPDLVTAGGDTVAVRMPGHPAPVALARGLGRPVTGTSANPSGSEDIPDFQILEKVLGGKVDCLLRCGPEPAGIASTIVDVTGSTPRLLREGALDFEQILAACR